MPRVRRFLAVLLALVLAPMATRAERINWTPVGAEAAVAIELQAAPAPTSLEAPTSLALYLTGLPFDRVGTVNDATLIADLARDGHRVAVADFSALASSYHSIADFVPTLVALRADLQSKQLDFGPSVDLNRVFLVPAGCRLLTDVAFYAAPGRTLALDLIYPAEPAVPVGTVLEFSCDNANRMGNFSLNFCTDTLMPVAALAGHAAAMADHPVDAPYKGLDAMPESGYRAAAAVQVLRAATVERQLPLNDRIVSAGFSRGSGMALFLATTGHLGTFVDHGIAHGPSADVQGGIIMSGRFTYLDLLTDDPMIPRYEKAWGPIESAVRIWRGAGALDYLDPENPPPPLFLTITPNESPHALHQMTVLQKKLKQQRVPFVFVPEPAPRGHKMPVDADVTKSLIQYLRARLTR
ncbi:hypothetical protein [Actomonas aquatica]|uniref:Alpha/beta hydrolase n=1 Tax=Actomonas aquatica TaxID=2866162 RepID=A0ABZ1C977_9BACT|nr:hypothetical protein [Opitutus sp. WL0086]WRQ88243.1 hypothetical protein K1X11_002415 [Opitutus sp. WL0086]